MLIRVALSCESAQQWNAHALEYDVVVEATTADAALDVLLKVVHAQMVHDFRQGRPLLGAFAGAPQRVWDTFSSAAARKPPINLTGGEDATRFQMLVATREDGAA